MKSNPFPQLKFGPFLADLNAGELRKDGRRIRLQEKPTRVLAALTAEPGVVISRASLQEHLWPDHSYGDFETGLNTAVRKLREALCDSASRPRYVETIPKRGYRFLARVEAIPESKILSFSSGGTLPAQPASTKVVVSTQKGGLHASADKEIVMSQDDLRTGSTAERLITIVVLPVQNLTGDPENNYVCDGFTEEITVQLGQLRDQRLGVIGRTSAMSYRNGAKSLREIGEELGAKYALEGSLRKSKDALLITAQLVNTGDHTQIWVHRFIRAVSDLSILQLEVAQSIAHETRSAIGLPTKSTADAPQTV